MLNPQDQANFEKAVRSATGRGVNDIDFDLSKPGERERRNAVYRKYRREARESKRDELCPHMREVIALCDDYGLVISGDGSGLNDPRLFCPVCDLTVEEISDCFLPEEKA